MCWVTSNIITPIISLGSSILGATTSAIQSKGTPHNSGGIRVGSFSHQKTCNISEKGQDRTKVTIDD